MRTRVSVRNLRIREDTAKYLRNLDTRYRGTSRIRNNAPLGPYSRPYGGRRGGGRFLMSEVPLYGRQFYRGDIWGFITNR